MQHETAPTYLCASSSSVSVRSASRRGVQSWCLFLLVRYMCICGICLSNGGAVLSFVVRLPVDGIVSVGRGFHYTGTHNMCLYVYRHLLLVSLCVDSFARSLCFLLFVSPMSHGLLLISTKNRVTVHFPTETRLVLGNLTQNN